MNLASRARFPAFREAGSKARRALDGAQTAGDYSKENDMQQRPFFQAAKTTIQRLRPWTAVTSALLLLGCSSLTPERVNTLADIAGRAVAVGAAAWLEKHTNHVDSFNAVIAGLSHLQKVGNTNQDAWVELLSSLPTDGFTSADGGLYWSGLSTNAIHNEASSTNRSYGGVLVWDAKINKSTLVRGPAVVPVLRKTLSGLKRATLPKPPRLVALNKPQYLELDAPNPAIPVTAVASATDVTSNSVTLRWLATPGSRYQIERRDVFSPNSVGPWVKVATPTNGAGPATWAVVWPTNRAAGEWRVVRAK